MNFDHTPTLRRLEALYKVVAYPFLSPIRRSP